MLTNTLISKVLGMTPQGVGKWRKENRQIIHLLEKYFTPNDLLEFINKESIGRYDFFSMVEPELIHKYSSLKFDFIENPYSEKFYWDFLKRYKQDIINLNRITIKNDFLSLLFDYYTQLIKITNIIGYEDTKISKDFQDFYTIFSEKDDTFFILLLNLIKHDFIPYNSFLTDEQFPVDYENLKADFLPYKDKTLLLIPIEQIKTLNKINPHRYDADPQEIQYRKKDFFEVYEDYITSIMPF